MPAASTQLKQFVHSRSLNCRQTRRHPTLATHSTIYAIGDVHGRSDRLDRIVAFVQQDALNRECRPLVFFLRRHRRPKGPTAAVPAKIVCETIQRWPGSHLILGNHDYMFRDALTVQRHDILKWLLRNGGQETLASTQEHPNTILQRF